jgi:hypothetical protein
MSACDPVNDELRTELLRRRDTDQAGRAEFNSKDPEELRRLMEVDDDNAAWLSSVIDKVGWPRRSLVGEEGSHAAWLLAQHSDRYPDVQGRCLKLLEQAVVAGEASAGDLAHLTDRVLLASGSLQCYGTQITAREGKYIPCRLRDPETVNARRAAVGLEPIEAHLVRALELYGPPRPACMQCPACKANCEIWLPEMGGTSTARCLSCGYVIGLRGRMRPGVLRSATDPRAIDT